jgi:hypothetical protein
LPANHLPRGRKRFPQNKAAVLASPLCAIRSRAGKWIPSDCPRREVWIRRFEREALAMSRPEPPSLQPLVEQTAPRLAESSELEKSRRYFGFSVEKFEVWLFSNI